MSVAGAGEIELQENKLSRKLSMSSKKRGSILDFRGAADAVMTRTGIGSTSVLQGESAVGKVMEHKLRLKKVLDKMLTRRALPQVCSFIIYLAVATAASSSFIQAYDGTKYAIAMRNVFDDIKFQDDVSSIACRRVLDKALKRTPFRPPSPLSPSSSSIFSCCVTPYSLPLTPGLVPHLTLPLSRLGYYSLSSGF